MKKFESVKNNVKQKKNSFQTRKCNIYLYHSKKKSKEKEKDFQKKSQTCSIYFKFCFIRFKHFSSFLL